MKKIVSIVAAAAMAASMFAVDFAANVQMDTTIAEKNGKAVDFLKLNKTNQKDSDALIISANGEKAGGKFQAWYNFDGTDETAVTTDDEGKLSVNGLSIRNASLWFKPLDALKVEIGNGLSLDSYKEHIFWWHGVYGAQPGSWGAFGGSYISGNGATVNYDGIENLSLTAAFFPGVDTAFVSTAKNYGNKAYGIKAKYNFGAGTATALWADKGTGAGKYIAIGGDFGNEWGGPFYAFVNASINLDKDAKLSGFAIDNSEKFIADKLTIQTHLPFVMWKNGDKMEAGMYATVKATYALDGCSPYFLATTEPDGDAGFVFSNFKFNMTFKPGVTFNVGAAAVDIAARVDIADGKLSGWTIPCCFDISL